MISIMDERRRTRRIEIQSPSRKEPHVFVGPDGEPVRHHRLIKGTELTTYEALVEAAGSPHALSDVLIESDPEIDLAQVGRRLGSTSRVYLSPDGSVLYVARVLKVIYDPFGDEIEPRRVRRRGSERRRRASPDPVDGAPDA